MYYDLNEDGRHDVNEPAAPNSSVTAEGPTTLVTYTDTAGQYRILLEPGEDYTLTINDHGCNGTPGEVRVAVAATSDTVLTRNFGLRYTTSAPTLTPGLESSAIRCGFTIPFWLTVTNDGCQTQTGEVTIELPEEASLVSSDLTPASNEDGTITWNYADLAPGANHQIRLQLKMPDETFTGQKIPILAHTLTIDTEGMEVRDTFHYNDILRCAIDPNDKRSWPSRQEESMSNYTQLDEAITYTIRFQNTGNDTAFTVRLEDKLSDQLDLETFKPLTASHDYRATILEGGTLEVLFENILLVDSVRNEPESHGFFTFEIKPNENVSDFTAIENTAGIYFDFNQPVITNTTKNTIVEVLDADQDGYYFFEECNDTNAAINPGVADIPGNGIDENCDGVDGTTAVREFAGTIVRLAPNPTRDAVQLTLSEDDDYRYSLYNLQGQRIANWRVP